MVSILKKILGKNNNTDINTDDEVENVEDECRKRTEEVMKNFEKEKNER
jgi:hypothetical protein